jgi:ABC-type transport system involved in multi-copper enzyme maturation permease subunit
MNASITNTAMVRRLILKDWYFHRWAILAYIVTGAIALGLVAKGGEGAFYLGSVLLITVLIAVGIHLPMATVVEERKEQTLAFVMSLPISSQEYTTAKVLGNLLIFLVPWLTLMAGTVFVIAGRQALPNGLIPFAAILLVEILASTCLILGVALVSESQGWTIGAIVFGNLLFQGFLYYVSHIPSVAAAMQSPTAVWNSAEITLLVVEVAAIALILGLTFYLQSRKTDFL